MSEHHKHTLTNVITPIVSAGPTIFYCVYSGIFLQKLKDMPTCSGVRKNGDPMDVVDIYT